ncbi:hypothetical protein [Streptomyces decoyicus]
MTQIDIGEPTDTERIADRLDTFRLAERELRGKDWSNGLDVTDVINLAYYLVHKPEGSK